jgi:Protein of unknown function (DUF2924)
MPSTLENQIESLNRQSVRQLRELYAATFGETTNAGNRSWLVRKIAWRMQANEQGGLTEKVRQRARELANDADLRVVPPKAASPTHAPNPVGSSATTAAREPLPAKRDPRLPAPGTIVTKQYKGETLQVLLQADGFEFRGERYASLSAIAKRITGSHINGFAFFQLSSNRKGAN